MADDLKWALSEFESGQRREMYFKAIAYDQGEHPMKFVTRSFEQAFGQSFRGYKENMCAAVVDALTDRLEVTGFSSNKAEIVTEEATSQMIPPTPGLPNPPKRQKTKVVDDLAQAAWDIWERNLMEVRSDEVHREAILTGDAYAIVWPGDDGMASIFPQLANEMGIEYDPNTYGLVARATKCWWDYVEKKWRLNIYLPDLIVKYISREGTAFIPVNGPGSWTYFESVPNRYDRVPVFHFPNRVENKYGRTELIDVFPLQDGLNKSAVDMLVAMEYASYKQRYILGMDVETDEEGQPVDQTVRNYGVDRMMAIPDPEAKVGQFDATDLNQFLRVQDKFWMSCARVTGTPLHYFYITTGDFPSGEAIKSAEGRFIKRIVNRQVAFGAQWEQVIRFALILEEGATMEDEFDSLWDPATPRSESELADTAVKKKTIGVPRSTLLRELGYSDDEIDRMLEEADAEALQKFTLAQTVGGPGRPPGENLPPESRDTSRARQGVPGAGG